MKNNNQKVIRRLSKRSLKKNRMRNSFAIIAIALTALLFTTLFTLGMGMIQVTEEQTMRRVGTRAHAGLKNITIEQYENMISHPLVEDCSYNILIAVAKNEELIKRQTEIRYAEAKDIQFSFVKLKEGKLPEKENEILVDTIVMEMLGLPHEVGAKVPLIFEFMGEEKKETFTVSGWYEGDPIMMASEIYLSRAYLDHISENYTEEDFVEAYNNNSNGIGLIQGSIMFQNSIDIVGNMNKVIEDSGYSIDEINVGINWAYLSQQSMNLDLVSIMIIVVIFLVVLLSGYLIIYNIFQISIIGEIRFYGLLKTIGATKKQIKRLVFMQAVLLSMIGIPIGIILGYFVGNVILPLLLRINSGIGITEFHIKPNPYIFLFGALFSFITVFLSCRKPGKIAGSVSPVEAAKYSEVNSIKRKTRKSKRGAKLPGMAFANLKRNKKKTLVTILSLSLSVVIMVQVVTFSKSISIDQYLEIIITGDFTICSVSLMNYISPMHDLKVPEDILDAANSQEGIDNSSRMFHTKRTVNHTLSDRGNQRFLEFYDRGLIYVYDGENSNRALIDHIMNNNAPISEQRYSFDEKLLNKLKVLDGSLDLEEFKSGDYILVVPYPDMEGTYYLPGDKVKLQYHSTASSMEEVYDSSGLFINTIWVKDRTKEYEVMAVVEIPYSMTVRAYMPNSLTTIVPVEDFLANDMDAECFAVSYEVEDEKEAAFERFLQNYTTKVNPNTDYKSKESLRDDISSYKNSINLIGGALSFIVGIIGIINFINTMLTSVITRKREFAIMQSIGLTNAKLKRMLIYEGLYYIGFTAIISFVIASTLSVSAVRAFNKIALFFEYQFTLLPYLTLIPIFLLVGFIIPNIAYHNAKRLSIVERLREGE